MDSKTVLEAVQNGSMSISEAERYFNRKAYEDMGYAKLDTYRELRSGFPEVVYCPNKPDAYLQAIYVRLLAEQGEVFGTRATPEQAELVRLVVPNIVYSPLAKTLKLEKPNKQREGLIAVCTAGTADVPVAEEAAQTAEFFGAQVERHYDVGVSGLHRLVSKMEALQQANCIVAVAGMETKKGDPLCSRLLQKCISTLSFSLSKFSFCYPKAKDSHRDYNCAYV